MNGKERKGFWLKSDIDTRIKYLNIIIYNVSVSYLTIKKSFGKHLISLPESIDIKLDKILVNSKPFPVEPDVIYNQYIIKGKSIPKAKKIVFISKEKQYTADYLLKRGSIIFKKGKMGFGTISSSNGIVKSYFFNELYPDIDAIIKNRYLTTMRNYSWLFTKFVYDRTFLKKKTDLSLFSSAFPESFILTSYGMINKFFVSYLDIAKLYNILEQEKTNLQEADSLVKKYITVEKEKAFSDIKKQIADFNKGKTKDIVSFVTKFTIGI